MNVHEFLDWLDTAPASRRAEAAHALGRAFLHAEVDDDARGRMETALTILLDDPSPVVRFSLADALAASPDAPRNVILSLATDHIDIASLVLSRSPVLLDAELVDLVATMVEPLQEAIASRPVLSAGVSAAITELGEAQACRILLDNAGADIARVSLERLAQRFGSDDEIRAVLLERPGLPVEIRQALVRDLSRALGVLAFSRAWLGEDEADRITRDACDQATASMAAETPHEDLVALAEHLRLTEQLTTSLLLRTLCVGNIDFFAASLSVLSGLPGRRVRSLVLDGRSSSLRAVYDRARLPAFAFEAFAAAASTCRDRAAGDLAPEARYRLTRGVVEEVLGRYEQVGHGELNELRAMLRRFAVDAARASAREFALVRPRAA